MLSKIESTLQDIQENIVIAQQIVADKSFDEFEQSRILFYAATRCLEIISEASRRLPEEFRAKHADMPWREMMDAGNFYRHQYSNVLEHRVWRTIHESLPPLLAVVLAELGDSAQP